MVDRSAHGSNGTPYTSKHSSYGYDSRVSPRATGKHAVMADMDGTYWNCCRGTSSNHEVGQNVLFVDGHAAWSESSFPSSNPQDNIFMEDSRNADVDSYVVRAGAPLTKSFDDYPKLHYPGEQH